MKLQQKQDYTILIAAVFLVLFGLVMLASASANLGEHKLGDNYFYVRHQLLYGILAGLILFFVTSKIYYGIYEKLAMPFLILSLVLLLLIYTPFGVKAGGALRWLSLGNITFQPSEFLKLTSVIYFAAWLSGDKERQQNFWRGFVLLSW